MSKAPRPAAPPDIRAARKILDEAAESRRTIKDLRKDIEKLNARARKAEREVETLKAKPAPKAKGTSR